jgi:rhamnopyranosyl-N-acetylglucosaminyl-diphospho-decaprenol beta-1,3/1,4-galactofuranosyltransferase
MQRINVVIITYNNVTMLRNLLRDLATQSRVGNAIYVVDNASVDDTSLIMAKEFVYVTYIRLSENTGSAGGYAAGIKAAMNHADGIWTFDDDVQLESDSLKNLVAGYNEISKTRPLGAVRSVGTNHPENLPTELEIAPWRGTLWNCELLRKMGPPRSDYFLYGEDLEYSLRMHKFGYVCYWVPTSKCAEIRQGKTDEQFLGVPVRIYPSAFRLYYAFRSEFNIFLEYRVIHKIAHLLLYALKVIVYTAFTERLKGRQKIDAVILGLIHGLIGQLGKNSKYLP